MRKLAMCAAAGALVLVGCDGRQNRTITNPDTGERVRLETGSGAGAPANMPAFAPLYPGARIESTIAGTGSAQGGSNLGGMVTFRVSDRPEQVAAFYRSSLDRSGLTERNEANLNGVLVLTGGHPDDSDRGLQVSIAPNTDGPGSFVTLVYSFGEG